MSKSVGTKRVFKFAELSERAKERARDWWRSRIESDDYDFVVDDFKTFLAAVGFSDIKLHWSGFYSQGDGASFAAKLHPCLFSLEDLEEQLGNEDNCCNVELWSFAWRIKAFITADPNLWVKVYDSHRGHTMSVDVDTVLDGDVEAELKELCDDLASYFYNSLQEQNEYLNSDECVDESIECNEYTFDEDGYRDD